MLVSVVLLQPAAISREAPSKEEETAVASFIGEKCPFFRNKMQFFAYKQDGPSQRTGDLAISGYFLKRSDVSRAESSLQLEVEPRLQLDRARTERVLSLPKRRAFYVVHYPI